MINNSRIFTQHIAPIEIFPGSVNLETDEGENVGGPIMGNVSGYPRRQVFSMRGRINFARIIMFDGLRTSTIEADYTEGNPSSEEGIIKIWVKQSSAGNANLVVRKGSDRNLQIDIDNVNQKFDVPVGSSEPTHRRKRRTYSETEARLCRVNLSRVEGDIPRGERDRIVLIQIWPEMMLP